jgi:hypothetical protein
MYRLISCCTVVTACRVQQQYMLSRRQIQSCSLLQTRKQGTEPRLYFCAMHNTTTKPLALGACFGEVNTAFNRTSIRTTKLTRTQRRALLPNRPKGHCCGRCTMSMPLKPQFDNNDPWIDFRLGKLKSHTGTAKLILVLGPMSCGERDAVSLGFCFKDFRLALHHGGETSAKFFGTFSAQFFVVWCYNKVYRNAKRHWTHFF